MPFPVSLAHVGHPHSEGTQLVLAHSITTSQPGAPHWISWWQITSHPWSTSNGLKHFFRPSWKSPLFLDFLNEWVCGGFSYLLLKVQFFRVWLFKSFKDEQFLKAYPLPLKKEKNIDLQIGKKPQSHLIKCIFYMTDIYRLSLRDSRAGSAGPKCCSYYYPGTKWG